MSANSVALAYLIASVFFILALKGLSSPLTARRGNLFGMVGMAIAVVTTLTITKNWALILACIAIGGSHWRSCGAARANDSNAGAGCLHALAGGPGSGIHRYCRRQQSRFIRIARDTAHGQQAGAVPRHVHRRHDLVRVGDRIPEAVGPHERRAGHLWRPAYGQPDPGDCDGRFRPVVLLQRDHQLDSFCHDDRDCVRARFSDHHPDRRRGYAGGHFDAELVLGLGGGGHRLLAGQPDADHRGLAGGQLGRDPVLHHVQGHEPPFFNVILGGFGSEASGCGGRATAEQKTGTAAAAPTMRHS